jgi:hypothetical protein
VSVDNLDGNGLANQPSVIYGYTDDTDELHIKELSRSGYGDPGPSPGDVIDRETTKSSLDDGLPELPMPGQDGLQYDDCGEDIPAFACEDCGSPTYVGRTCANPLCSRDWASAVKSKTVRTAGKLWAMQQVLNSRQQKNIDFNHVVASMPDFLVDSDDPLDRALLVLKTLLKHHWGIENFTAIYHPYRIKKEYRKDQYEHHGESGEGDMTWKDVLSADNPNTYTYDSPHFHLFFPAKRKSFDYSVAEYVQSHSGWNFHRITKGGPQSDSNVSVEDLDDLVHQLTYCFSHAGVQRVADRHELCSRLKGEIHNLYVPDGITDDVLASFCDAAPRLLGVQFANLNDATCSAEVSATEDDTQDGDSEQSDHPDADADHPLYDVFDYAAPGDSEFSPSKSSAGGDPWPSGELDSTAGSGSGDGWTSTTAHGIASTDTVTKSAGAEDGAAPDTATDTDSPMVDAREPCNGDLVPLRDARDLLNDAAWCRQAEHVSGLRTAVEEWERLTDGEEDLPWTDADSDDPDGSASTVIEGD